MMGRGKSVTFAKPKSKPTQVLRRMWPYLSRYRWIIVLACVLSLSANALALLSPKLSGKAIDAIVPGNVDFPVVYKYVLAMVIVAVVSALLSWALSAMMITLSRNVIRKMRSDLFNHLTQLPISFFDTHLAGDVISVLSYDCDTVGTSLSNDITQILSSAVTVVGSFSMMLTISPKLLLVFAFTIPASVLFTRYRSKIVRPLFRRRSKKLGELNGYSEETMSGLKTIQAYHQEGEFNRRFTLHNNEAVEANWKADHTNCITGPTVNLINNISMALVSIFGSIMYMTGGITLGNVSSFVLYSRKFSGPINEFANIISELQSALAAAERVLSLCDMETEQPDKPDALQLSRCTGHVELKDVCFGYTPETEVLHHISMDIAPGKTIALAGETGCGKTTLVSLLMRFYDVTSGSITLDGTDIRQISRQSLRSQFTMVLQDTWLFDGTIFDNIAYGCPGATMEQVVAAAKSAHIHHMIESLPEGYMTNIQDSGNSISKGQKQLITIARAMLMDSPILILDEATSNVDTRTELMIQDAMLKLQKGRTSFVIAHRLSTITGADCILVMDKGRIVEKGTHKELLEKKGAYYELYTAQFDMPSAM